MQVDTESQPRHAIPSYERGNSRYVISIAEDFAAIKRQTMTKGKEKKGGENWRKGIMLDQLDPNAQGVSSIIYLCSLGILPIFCRTELGLDMKPCHVWCRLLRG